MNCTGDTCLNGGQCSFNGICLCAPCFAGTLCEININVIQLPLTTLMRWDIENAEIIDDFNCTKFIYIFFIALMVIMSIISNMLSLQTFLRYEIRQTNCGIYQILISVISLMNVIALQLRLITIVWLDYLTEAYAYRYIVCDILPVIHLVMDNMCTWIGTLVAIEFILLESFNLNLHRSRWLSIILSIIAFLGVFGAYIHILIYRRPLPDPHRPDLYTCTFIRPLDTVTIDKITLTVHLIIPTLIQLIASIWILISTTKRVGFVFNRHDFLKIFLNECWKRKHFFVPLFFISFSNLPHVYLHLRDACEDARNLSVLRLHMAFIFLGYLPELMTFFIYIYPSTSYMNNFKRTWSGRLLTRMFKSCRSKEQITAVQCSNSTKDDSRINNLDLIQNSEEAILTADKSVFVFSITYGVCTNA